MITNSLNIKTLTFDQLQDCIDKAETFEACSQNIMKLRSFNTIEDFLTDANSSYWTYWYVKHIIKHRWPEAEEVIRRDPEWAYRYAVSIIQGRWPEAEDVIRQDPQYAYYYARDVTKGRWPEAEEVIRQDSEYAYYYACNIWFYILVFAFP